jgi:predicted DsbA family dithiol-disulfide isomerase
MALFEAFFTHRKNINEPDVLAAAAEQIGLDREEATAVLAKGGFADAVGDEENYWFSNGIGGVPAMILYQKQLVTGAQGIPNHVALLHYFAGNQAA